jgi:L-alanine-DL-glutamate epimerase-like enolase superfamily enzyme
MTSDPASRPPVRYARATAELWRLPLSAPAGGSGISAVDVIVVEVEDSDGRVGVGFSYVLGAGGAVVRAHASDLLDRFIVGQPGIPPQALWRRLAGSLNRLGRGVGYLAIAAIDVAAWDLHAKALGVPLAVAMGGTPRAVPVYGSGGFGAAQDPEEAIVQALTYAERGCKAVKLRVAGNTADIARIGAVADQLPPDVDIMVDANEKCDLAHAQWLANACVQLGVLWLEEPLPASDLGGYATLSKTARVAIATGEHLQGTAEVMPYLDARAVSVVQPDLAMMGGLTETLRVAQLAEQFGLAVSPHFLPALFVHVAAAAPAVKWLEDFPLLEPLFEGLADFGLDGTMLPPGGAGHGMRLVPDAGERYRVEA